MYFVVSFLLKYLNQYMEETKEKFDHIKDKINRALNDEEEN